MTHDASATIDLLIGCYTDDEGHDGVVPCRLTGAAPEPAGRGLQLRNPSWLVAFGDHVLAVCELPESRLAVLRRTHDGVEVVSDQPTHGADACHLAVSPDEAWVAVANYTSGQVTLFRAPRDGQLEATTAVHTFTGSGPVKGRQDTAHAHQITWLDETHFLVSDLGSDMLRVMRVGENGSLSELAPVVLPAGMGPRHAVTRTTAAGEFQLAIGGELSGEVVSLRHEGQDWDAGWWIVDHRPGTFRVGESQPSGLRFFGDDLVLGNRRTNTLALLRWNEEGRLHLVSEASCGGDEPRDLVVHDGQVWVANQHGSCIAVLSCAADEFEVVSTTSVRTPASLLFTAR